MKHRYLIANWKMNLTRAEARDYLYSFQGTYKPRSDLSVIFCPSFTTIDTVRDGIEGLQNVSLGAQNVHWEDAGAHTGEISTKMLLELGVKYVIVGHSERYLHYGETPEGVNKRARKALSAGLRPIVCVGETKEQFETQRSKSVVSDQLLRSLDGFSEKDAAHTIVAYEPVWAIGTGMPATPEIAEGMHETIRKELSVLFPGVGGSIPILYGGSTKPENIKSFVEQREIFGGLVGGASWDPTTFCKMIEQG